VAAGRGSYIKVDETVDNIPLRYPNLYSGYQVSVYFNPLDIDLMETLFLFSE